MVVEDLAHVVVRTAAEDYTTPIMPQWKWAGPLMGMLRELGSSHWGNFSYNVTLPSNASSYSEAYQMIEDGTPVMGRDGRAWSRPADM